MNAQFPATFFIAICLLFSACQRPLIVDDDATNTEANWDLLDFKSERLIQGMHATPFELYTISENQFSRFDSDHNLIEKRPLETYSGVRGIPAMSDNTFVRLTIDDAARQTIEFHLSRTPSQIVRIPADSLAGPNDDLLEVEFLARSLGVFSSDGTLFLLPAQVFPARKYSLFLFEVLHNQAHNVFTSVEVVKRIDLDLSADFASIVSLRFLNGSFYVTSREGAWRITPSGTAEKIFPQWMRDVFSWQGNLYITGLNAFDLHESSDNGLTWERLNQNTELDIVETAGDLVFTQKVWGTVFSMMPDDFIKAKKIVYPPGFSETDPIYYGVVFLGGNYYFSLDREVYFTTEVVTK